MGHKINHISRILYAKGNEMGQDINSILVKNKIEIISKSPMTISFIPYSVNNPKVDANIRGKILWNPINDCIIVQYILCMPFTEFTEEYSRCLKYYLTKWNESRSCMLRRVKLYFIYPGVTNREIILQASSKISKVTQKKKIRMLLFQLHDTMQEESEIIISILERNPPSEFKDAITEEIYILLSELAISTRC